MKNYKAEVGDVICFFNEYTIVEVLGDYIIKMRGRDARIHEGRWHRYEGDFVLVKKRILYSYHPEWL